MWQKIIETLSINATTVIMMQQFFAMVLIVTQYHLCSSEDDSTAPTIPIPSGFTEEATGRNDEIKDNRASRRKPSSLVSPCSPGADYDFQILPRKSGGKLFHVTLVANFMVILVAIPLASMLAFFTRARVSYCVIYSISLIHVNLKTVSPGVFDKQR